MSHIWATSVDDPLLGTAPGAVEPPRYYAATVVGVHDGDTITVNLDLGLGFWSLDEHVRMRGFNAPELSTPAGPPARDALLALLPVGTAIVLEVGADAFEKYGRLLAVAWLPDGRSANREMYRGGYHA